MPSSMPGLSDCRSSAAMKRERECCILPREGDWTWVAPRGFSSILMADTSKPYRLEPPPSLERVAFRDGIERGYDHLPASGCVSTVMSEDPEAMLRVVRV